MTTVDNETDRVEWEDIETIARELFKIWEGRPELSWARHAWGALDSAGLTSYSTEVERSQCLIRLLVLAAIYHEFCVRAFGEGDSGGWQEVVDLADLTGDGFPRFDAFTLGQLAERSGIDVDNGPDVDGNVMGEVLHELTVAEHPTVVQALLRTASQAGLQTVEARVFAELWLSGDSEIAYPITDDEVSDIVNHDLTAGKNSAHEWLVDGLAIA